MRACLCLAATVAVLSALTHAAPSADEVTSLPDYNGSLPSKHYSGYLKALQGSWLHYYYVEASEVAPATAPVVLWLNGGPGCSSMDGWGYELGPFHFKDFGSNGPTFTLNSQTWTRFANVIFLEAPPGVGFSYREDGNYTITDTENGANNYAALLDFFNNKFPEFKANKFYVAGESYAGVYVPTLVNEILVGGGLPSFSGMLVGNGCTSSDCDDYVGGDLKFAFYHGLIPESLYLEGKLVCDRNMSSDACTKNQDKYYGVFTADVNPYGVYYKCFQPPSMSNWRHVPSLKRRYAALARNAGMSTEAYVARVEKAATGYSSPPRPHESAAARAAREEETLAGKVASSVPAGPVPPSPAGGQVPCIDSMALQQYLNRPDVKAALHVQPTLNWWICSSINYVGDMPNVAFVYEKLRARKVPMLVYNGNIDTSVPYTEVDDWFKKSLSKWSVTREMLPWSFKDPLYQWGDQLGGYAVQREGLLWYTTINGAGHMVPQFRPAAALAMFLRFLNGTGF